MDCKELIYSDKIYLGSEDGFNCKNRKTCNNIIF